MVQERELAVGPEPFLQEEDTLTDIPIAGPDSVTFSLPSPSPTYELPEAPPAANVWQPAPAAAPLSQEIYTTAPEPQDSDSVASSMPRLVMVYVDPESSIEAAPLRQGNEGVSFILVGLFLLFLIVALRFRNNMKYVVTMFHDLIETRTRHNVFDETVQETSLVVLLNVMWCVCAGITGYCFFRFFNPGEAEWLHRSIGMLLGMAVAAVYTLFMWGAYSSVGWIFSDRTHAALWVKGFASSQALMTPALFLTALIGVCNAGAGEAVGIAGACVFILVKLVFIWKGYRIFFSQISSWVLFLCYLCSLEIVPLFLCYRCSLLLGEVL